MLKTAFSTLSSPDWTWRDVLEWGPRHGYDGVEIRLIARETDLLQVPELRPAERPQRRRELDDAGFQVCGLASSVRFDHPDDAQWRAQLDVGRAYVDMAVELGASFVRVFGDVLPEKASAEERQAALQRIAEGLDRLGEYAGRHRITVALETHGDFTETRLTEELMRLVGDPAVGVLWDTHHPWRFYGEPVAETLERLRPWLCHTHWKDSVSLARRPADAASAAAAAEAHALMSGHKHADYVLFGGGEFPAEDCVRRLREAGYDGWYCLEWEKMWHPEIEGPEIVIPLFPAKIRRLWEWAQNDPN